MPSLPTGSAQIDLQGRRNSSFGNAIQPANIDKSRTVVRPLIELGFKETTPVGPPADAHTARPERCVTSPGKRSPAPNTTAFNMAGVASTPFTLYCNHFRAAVPKR
jgi:hypothetical protein